MEREDYRQLDYLIDRVRIIANNCYVKEIIKHNKEMKNVFVDMTLQQRRVLSTLYFMGPSSPTDICTHQTLTYSNISKVLKSLEDDGYIERRFDKNNRRFVIVHLTPSGKALMDDYQEMGLDAAISVLNDKLDEADQRRILELFEEVHQIWRKLEN